VADYEDPGWNKGASYRTRFFVGIGLAETPALAGVAGTLVGGLWIDVLALPFTLVGFGSSLPPEGTSRANRERSARPARHSPSGRCSWTTRQRAGTE
jgi:hypothetical protein